MMTIFTAFWLTLDFALCYILISSRDSIQLRMNLCVSVTGQCMDCSHESYRKTTNEFKPLLITGKYLSRFSKIWKTQKYKRETKACFCRQYFPTFYSFVCMSCDKIVISITKYLPVTMCNLPFIPENNSINYFWSSQEGVEF